MPFIPADDGVLLHYESTGSGQPLVLLHGWTMNGRFFQKNIDALAADHQVITIDMRGHGRSSKELIHLTMEQLGRDVATVLRSLDLQNVVLVGWSMGSLVVYNYLSQFGSERLGGFVEVDMSPYLLATADWPHAAFGNLTAESSLALQQQILTDRLGLTAAMLPGVFAAGSTPDAELMSWMADQIVPVPDLTALALWVSFTSQDWRPLLPSIDIPVLIAHGRKSQVCPTPVWEPLAAAIPDSSLALFDDSGHMSFWEQPDEFNTAVLDFAKQL